MHVLPQALAFTGYNSTNFNGSFLNNSLDLLPPNNSPSSVHSQVKAVVSQVILPIIFIVGLLGNSCNILIFSFKIYRRLHSGYTNVTDMSAVVGLLALAVSDIAFSASALPRLFLSSKIYTLDSSQWEQIRLAYVYVHHFLINVFICTSTWFTCVVSFERFLMICKPFHRQWNANLLRTVLTYCTVVTCSIVISLPLLLKYEYICTPPCPAVSNATVSKGLPTKPTVSSVYHRLYNVSATTHSSLGNRNYSANGGNSLLTDFSSCGECFLRPTAVLGDTKSSVTYYAIHSVLTGILPFFILLLCNVRLMMAVRANFDGRRRCGGGWNEAGGFANNGCNSSNIGNGMGGAKFYRITFILVLVVTMYLFLVAPSILIELLKPLIVTAATHDRYMTAIVITNAVQSINYSINFPIYMLSSRPFRNSFRKLFRKLCRRCCR